MHVPLAPVLTKSSGGRQRKGPLLHVSFGRNNMIGSLTGRKRTGWVGTGTCVTALAAMVFVALNYPEPVDAGEVHFNMYNYQAILYNESDNPIGWCRAHSTDPNMLDEDFPAAGGTNYCEDWDNDEQHCVSGEAHSDPRAGWVPNIGHSTESGCSGSM